MGRLLLARLLACLAAGAAAGCIDWGSLYHEAPDGGGATDGDATPGFDATPNPLGCSDGTAEVLMASAGIAACAGAWGIPGIVDETEPACGRAAGNDSKNPTGEGCAASDLCAAGWHVCRDAGDVAQHGGDSACARLAPPTPEGGEFIYLTRQRGAGDGPSCDPDGTDDSADDVWGCGTLGLETIDCKPLDHHLAIQEDGGGCQEPYLCGDDPAAEGRNVSKHEPEQGGGVLCCSDGDP